MNKHQRWFIGCGAVLALATADPVAAQAGSPPPVRQLGRRLAVTTDSLASVVGVRQLRDGHVLINDLVRRRLVLFDSALSHGVVIADSTPSTQKAYGNQFGAIIPYLGDSTIFVDASALAFVVLDPGGKIAHVISPPRPQDIASLIQPQGAVAFDARGRLIYRNTGAQMVMGMPMPVANSAAPSNATQSGGAVGNTLTGRNQFPHDSVAILRADMTTRQVDTAGFIATSTTQSHGMATDASGVIVVTQNINPIPVYDDWTVVADGSIAFVRALDYHIDWINPDGMHSSTPRMAHEWHRLTDSAKAAIMDSVRAQQDSIARARARTDSIAAAAGKPTAKGPNVRFVTNFVDPSDLPDYIPPFSDGAVKADADNNLWIRERIPGASPSDPPVYDIVNRKGQVTDRVQLPPTLALAGFGPGVVYLSVREGSGTVIAKYRIR